MTPIDWLTLALVLITAYYAYQTRKSTIIMERANESSLRPIINIFIQSTEASKNIIELIVKNEGNRSARNISFTLASEDLELNQQQPQYDKLSKLRFMKSGISLLGPHSQREYALLSVAGIYEEVCKKQIVICIDYKSDSGKLYSDSFALDFASLSESRWANDAMKSHETITKELPKIRTALEKAAEK